MQNWFAVAAAGVLSVFGFAGQHIPTSTVDFHTGTTTHHEEHDTRLASSTKAVANLPCVTSAISAREASLDSGVSTYTAAINDAYSVRASALASAYAQSGTDAIRAAVQNAWKQFTTSSQGARRAWQKSRESAWSTFRNAIKTCGPSASSISDSSNAGSEMSGQ